jgi:hypothetical protein
MQHQLQLRRSIEKWLFSAPQQRFWLVDKLGRA